MIKNFIYEYYRVNALMAIRKQVKYLKMVPLVIFAISFSLFAFPNIQYNAFAQNNDSSSEMLTAQINGTGTVPPSEEKTKYEGFSEPQTPSIEQLKAFEEEITEEELEYPQEFLKENPKEHKV
jgi:hypothetical protein